MNIFELIREDHRYMESLLDRIEQVDGEVGTDEPGRRDLVERLVAHNSRHEAAEEMVFWPAVRRRLSTGDRIADEALVQEGDARAQLDLLRFVTSPAALAEEVRRFHELAATHARFEEEAVFPELQRRTTRVWSGLSARKFLVARQAGPTRPHPNGPDHPIGLVAVGAPAAILDRLRERGRPRPHPRPGRPLAPAPAVVEADHRRINDLLARVEEQDDPTGALVLELIHEVSLHDSMERQYLYPAIRTRLQDGPSIYRSLMAEHRAIARLAARIQRYSPHDEARRAWLGELTSRLRTHMGWEESAVLPALVARATEEETVELGDDLLRARRRAPCLPHTSLAGSGPGARLAGRFTRPVDRVRDMRVRRRLRG